MTNKRFVIEEADTECMADICIADTSEVDFTLEDFWDYEDECYNYRKYIEHLWGDDAFLTIDEADELLNNLADENRHLKKENEELQNEVKELKGKASSWKITASEQIAEQSILMNEIYLMQEQGAKPSEAFEKYINKIKSDYND